MSDRCGALDVALRGLAEAQVEPGLALKLLRDSVPDGVEDLLNRGSQVLGVLKRTFVREPISVGD